MKDSTPMGWPAGVEEVSCTGSADCAAVLDLAHDEVSVSVVMSV